LHGQQRSIREIARIFAVSRNTVRKYLRAPGLPAMRARPPGPSKLDPFRDHVRTRLAAGIENCIVLLRERRAQGYTGGYSILKDYVRPLRLRRTIKATMRFETKPGEQAQVDFGHFAFVTPTGQRQWLWGFVMVLAWSRLLYVEFIRRADVATFLRCHLHAFEAFGGVPRHCLYDNTKVVVLGRDAGGVPHWNATFLDFALRVGFDARLCRPYRAQTKGRVESGIKYVRYNFWPTALAPRTTASATAKIAWNWSRTSPCPARPAMAVVDSARVSGIGARRAKTAVAPANFNKPALRGPLGRTTS